MDSSNQAKDGSLNATQNDDDSEKGFNVIAWRDRITKARNKEQSWRERAKKIIKIYRDDSSATDTGYTSPRSDGDSEYCFNILFANTETLLPALFSNSPKPDVRNRYLSQDKDAEDAANVIERCVTYSMDTYNFTKTMKNVVKDYILTGRGIARVRLIPKYETHVLPELDDFGSPVMEEDGTPSMTPQEVMSEQYILCEGVDWDSFVVEPCKRWEDVSWIAFVHMLSKEEFMEFFPDAPLTEASKETNQYSSDSKYKVYEIWDKNKKKIYFLGDGEKPLKIKDDEYKLTNFWPIPEPLYSIQTSDTLVPIPEYTLYQTQAEELNQISYRISDLVRACKFIGIYDAGEQDIGEVFQSKDSEFVAVTTNRMAQGGMKSLIDVIDTTGLARVLGELYAQRDKTKEIIYEITGISDIIRGQSVASETATAQNIKASYAGLRLRDRRSNIDTFIVELIRIQSEMLCRFFTLQQMQELSGIQINPNVERILSSDILRCHRIDIESDSTILPDMQAEAQRRAALVGSITQFLTAAAPLVAQGALPMETAKALLMFAVQPSKISRELEDALEMIGSKPPAPPQPPPMPGMPPQMGGMPSGLPHAPLAAQQGAPQGMPSLPPEIMAALHQQQ